MKISEIIKRLQEIQDEKGDLHVCVNSSSIYDVSYDKKYFIEIVNIHNMD